MNCSVVTNSKPNSGKGNGEYNLICTQGDYLSKSAQKNLWNVIKFPKDKEQQAGTTEPAYSSKSKLSDRQHRMISITDDLTNMVQQLH